MAGRRFRNSRSRKNANGGRRLTKKQLKQVKRIVTRSAEQKIYDVTSATTGFTNAGTLIGPFQQIPQNIGDSQRIGDRIYLKNVHSRMSFIYGDGTNVIRMIWFQWYPNTASETPLVGTILQTLNPRSMINDTNQDGQKFRVMLDKTYAMTQNGSNGCIQKNFRFYGRRLPRKKLQYNPAATTGFNQIYCLFISDSIAAPNPTVDMVVRTTYVDS